MINCEIIQDLMPLYADDLISPSGRQLVDRHIDTRADCKNLLKAMLAPVEPDPIKDDTAYLKALHKQKKRQIRRTVLLCVLPVLICFLGWWIYMERHFYGETPYIVTTDEEIIFTEMPELRLTEAEHLLATDVFHHPAFQEALSTGTVTEIPAEHVSDLLAAVIPEDASVTSIAVLSSHCICLDYQLEDLRIISEYIDADGTGTVDLIRKTIGVQDTKGETETVYSMEYAVGIERYWCEKQKMRHIWFSFLSLP